jgi:hypothetical protein
MSNVNMKFYKNPSRHALPGISYVLLIHILQRDNNITLLLAVVRFKKTLTVGTSERSSIVRQLLECWLSRGVLLN